CNCSLRGHYPTGSKGQRWVGLPESAISARLPASPPGRRIGVYPSARYRLALVTRAVLITGASTGIGEATARRLAGSGWRVFAGVRKDADAERLRSAGTTPVIVDVTDRESVSTAASQV